jgi:hypothetical protein
VLKKKKRGRQNCRLFLTLKYQHVTIIKTAMMLLNGREISGMARKIQRKNQTQIRN